MLCFDTNVVIAFLNGRPAQVAERFEQAIENDVWPAIPVIVVFELWHGVQKSARRAENEAAFRDLLSSRIEILDFNLNDALHAGDIFGNLRRLGTPIGHYDVLIAAQARSRGMTLVTANTREFERVPGLPIEDWTR